MSPTLLDKFNTVFDRVWKNCSDKHVIINEWKRCHNEQARVEHLYGEDVWESTFLIALEQWWGKFGKHKITVVFI